MHKQKPLDHLTCEGVLTEMQAEIQESFDGVPSYFERFIPNNGSIPVLIVVERCDVCGRWHTPENACPTLVEVRQ